MRPILARLESEPSSSQKEVVKSWKVAGCSRVGTAHRRRGHSCEDSFGWFRSGELLGIAIADGAGSATHAALGSALAAHFALTTILELQLGAELDNPGTARDALRLAAQCALNRIAAKAGELSVEPRELACTFLLVVGKRDFVAAAHVGDGAAVVMTDSGELISLTTPTNGEFANETPLLGFTSATDVCISSLAGFPIKAVAAFSDGMQRMALRMPAGTPHIPFFVPLFAKLQSLTECEGERFIGDFLDSPRVSARTDDDTTLVAASLL